MTLSEDSHKFADQAAAMVAKCDFFTLDRPVQVARAPGRIDFMGGNVDYTGGMVLQLPLCESVWAAAQTKAEPVLRILNSDASRFGWEPRIQVPVHEISSLAAIEDRCSHTPGAGWGRYVLGAFHLLNQRHGAFVGEGANLFLSSNLPPNRGVASSAALEIATLKAVSAAAGLRLEGARLAEAGQWVENVVAHSACGIMDQAAIVLGRRDCLTPFVCQPCSPLGHIALPAEMRIWGIDSMVPRSTCGVAYENARAAAFMGYSMICRWENREITQENSPRVPRWTDDRWHGYLSNLSASEFRSRYEAGLPEILDGREFLDYLGSHHDPFTTVYRDRSYPVRAAVRYAVEENLRIATVKCLLETLSPDRLQVTLPLIGELLYQSHWAYSECGLGARACDDLVAMARRFGFFGAKMTGGGAGGVVAVLGLATQEGALQKMVEEYGALCGEMPNVFRHSSDGVDISGAAAVYPASFRKAPKELERLGQIAALEVTG